MYIARPATSRTHAFPAHFRASHCDHIILAALCYPFPNDSHLLKSEATCEYYGRLPIPVTIIDASADDTQYHPTPGTMSDTKASVKDISGTSTAVNKLERERKRQEEAAKRREAREADAAIVNRFHLFRPPSGARYEKERPRSRQRKRAAKVSHSIG